MFLTNLAIEFLENIAINEHIIKLIKKNQPSYRFIYIFSLLKLEILKAHIKTYLKTEFIQTSKSFTSTSIFYDKKLEVNFYLCVNH